MGNGPNVAIGMQSFDEYGYAIGVEHRDENNNVVYNHYGIAASSTQFDNFGNMISRTFIGEDGVPSPHLIAGYTTLKIQYDITGNFRKHLEYFDENNMPIGHKKRGYWVVKYIYDSSDQLIRIEYLDIENNLVNRLDNGIAVIKYSYDQDGEIKETIRLNKNLSVIK